MTAPFSLCFLAIFPNAVSAAPYFPVLLFSGPCVPARVWTWSMCLAAGSQAASLPWEHQLILGCLYHSPLTCCLLMRHLSLVVHPLQEMHHGEQILCQCRQVVSPFSPEGILHISPNSTLFLAFAKSKLLAYFQSSSKFLTFLLLLLVFFNFRKIIT